MATHVTEPCQTLVEQVAVMGVEAALAKGGAAEHKSALSSAEKVQGNTRRALDQALNLTNKRGEGLETGKRGPESGRRGEVEGQGELC